jgi:hypothetical protein
LLGTLIDKLKCTFETTANLEDIPLEVPAEPESLLVNKTVLVFGGSNMRSVVPEVEKNDFRIVDRTVLGWVPNPANLAKLSELIATAKDFLGKVTDRYAQEMAHSGCLSKATVPLQRCH